VGLHSSRFDLRSLDSLHVFFSRCRLLIRQIRPPMACILWLHHCHSSCKFILSHHKPLFTQSSATPRALQHPRITRPLLTPNQWILLRLVTHNTLSQKVLFSALLFLIGLGLTLVLPPLMAEITYVVEAKEREKPGRSVPPVLTPKPTASLSQPSPLVPLSVLFGLVMWRIKRVGGR
jgi:hypothetical protein